MTCFKNAVFPKEQGEEFKVEIAENEGTAFTIHVEELATANENTTVSGAAVVQFPITLMKQLFFILLFLNANSTGLHFSGSLSGESF